MDNMDNYALQNEITALKEIIIRLEKEITDNKSYIEYIEKLNRELKQKIKDLEVERDVEV